MGGKRSSKRSRRGGGKGRGGNDVFERGGSSQSSIREPPSRQSQHHNLGRKDKPAADRRQQEPPTDYLSGNDNIEFRSNKKSNRAGSLPVTRAEQKRTATATTARQDPPDEIQSISSSHQSVCTINNSNRNGRNRRKLNGHFNQQDKQYHHNIDDSPQLDANEQLQYEEYEDQHYSEHFCAPDPDQIQEYSSSHRQFTLAPLNVEMTSLNGKASRERKAKKEDIRLKKQQKAQRSRFSQGRYEQVNSNQSDSDDVSDDYSYGDVDYEEDISEHETTKHEMFYNYDDDEEEEEDSDYEDEDEERPLRRSKKSNRRRLNQGRSAPILTRCERFQNRALVAAFALVALLFVRDHTPWWKKHKARVEFAKHHHHHKDGSDDDDSVRNVKLDPMAVYNTNDDDSTHTKDHDPLHQYIKEDNKYNEHSAGERISGRPAQKSLNHGFMDESYENRPEAKNSASTAAAAAGVRMSGPNAVVNEEEAAFLKSVKGKANQYSANTDAGNRDKVMPPPPPPPESPSTPSDATSFSSAAVPQVEEKSEQPVTTDINANAEGALEAQPSSFTTEVITEQQQQQQQQQPQIEYGDSLVEWGGQQEQEAQLEPQEEQEAHIEATQNVANVSPPNDSVAYPQSPIQSTSSSTTGFKPMANEAMSGSAFMSSSLQAQNAQEIKDVYKTSYYRWNHPFRKNASEGEGRDVPVFWRIPRSASSAVEDVMSNCYHLAVASALGTRQGHDQDQTLSVVPFGNAKYVNVDMSNPAGIQRAKAMNLGASGMADAISTPFVYETASIFEDVPDSGKCFTMLRHPVDRAVSLYHRYQSDDSNPNTAQYKGMTIDEYAEKSTESNWMVRFLTSKRAGALSWHDLESAKEVFGRKCLVGLVDKAEESVRRYERFFGWGDGQYNECVCERLVKADKRNQHETYEGTNAWEALRKKNEYDVLLYEYAKNLYTQQSTMYENFH